MNLGIRLCGNCKKPIQLKITRDLVRKRFCSRRCSNIITGKERPLESFATSIAAMNSPESNAKKSNKGPKHPNYNPNRKNLKRPRSGFEHSIWRKMIFERDNYTCQECKKRGGRLQADHIKTWKEFPELRYDLSNGRTLCEDCHKKTETYGIKLVWRMRRNVSITQ